MSAACFIFQQQALRFDAGKRRKREVIDAVTGLRPPYSGSGAGL
jgi:hypothetical protein